MNKTNLIIAFGGASPEHEVSVITAIQAASALDESSINKIPLYVTKSGTFLTGAHLLELESYKNLKNAEQKGIPCTFRFNENGVTVLSETNSGSFFSKPKTHPVDVVLTAFHGADGENGAFQGLCEMFNIPYTGSGTMASSVGMDKYAAKLFAEKLGVPVTPSVHIKESEWTKNRADILKSVLQLGETVFIKPAHLGSSIGVEKATGEKNIATTIENCFRYDDQLLAEKAISPLVEVNCSVLGDHEEATASVCEQPVGTSDLLSFDDKYMGGSGKGMASASRIIPAPISDELTKNIQGASVKLFKELNAGGVARFDFLINKETSEWYFNEINTIPGSFSFYLWEKTGVPFKSLILNLIELAQKRHRTKNGRVRSFETNLLSQKAVKGIKGLKGKG